MRARAALLVALSLLVGCSNRERLNPFDPQNPFTHGRPAGFVALAGDQTVTLRWNLTSAPDLTGYRIERAAGTDTGYVPITVVLPPTTSSFRDFGLANGVEHHYRLFYVFGDSRAALPAEDAAVPGPLSPWVTDYGAGTLLRLTADGRHIAETVVPVVSGTPSAVDVDIPGGVVWACDPYAGAISIYEPANQFLAVYRSAFQTPRAVVADTSDQTAWVADDGADAVFHLTRSGTPASPPQLAPLDGPLGLALDLADRALWICERNGNRVRRLLPAGTGFSVGMIAPSRVAVDSVTRRAWVTSFSRAKVVVISDAGARVDSIGAFEGPVGIAVDARRGRIWVADPVANQVVALRRDRTVEFRVGGLGGARELAVDPYSGEAWVTLGLDAQVARISPTGVVLGRLRGFSEPYAIALDIPRLHVGLVTPRP